MTLNEQTALLELEQAVEKVRCAVDDATFDHAESTGCARWIPADGNERPMDGGADDARRKKSSRH